VLSTDEVIKVAMGLVVTLGNHVGGDAAKTKVDIKTALRDAQTYVGQLETACLFGTDAEDKDLTDRTAKQLLGKAAVAAETLYAVNCAGQGLVKKGSSSA